MIDQLFSTPVYKSKVKNFNLIQKEVKCAIEIEKNNFDNIIFNGNIIKECKIKGLKKEIILSKLFFSISIAHLTSYSL